MTRETSRHDRDRFVDVVNARRPRDRLDEDPSVERRFLALRGADRTQGRRGFDVDVMNVGGSLDVRAEDNDPAGHAAILGR